MAPGGIGSVCMPKKISQSTIIGEQGIALIQRRVLEMGFVWHQRPGQVDAGIDGEIELRDSSSGIVLNTIILVQSKASDRPFPGETDLGFHFPCSRNDIEYWLSGNAPVILVCSHPASQEAWWVSIKDWFADPARLASGRVEFNKRTQRLDAASAPHLLRLAAPAGSGIYLRPPPRQEMLVSNLLQVRHIAPRIFSAPTHCRTPIEAYDCLREHDVRASDWLLRDRLIYALRPTDEPPLSFLCDGSVSSIATSEWAQSEDPTIRRKFVQLFNNTLRDITEDDLRWHRERHYLYFRPTADLQPRKISSGRSMQGRTVFEAYPSKREPSRVSYCRHAALRFQFVRAGGIWYVELVPTYHYTWNGVRDSRFMSSYLAEMKRRERNPAVLGQVQMWAHYLRARCGEETLLHAPDDRLGFGGLAQFQADRGIDDADWARPQTALQAPQDPRLFEVA